VTAVTGAPVTPAATPVELLYAARERQRVGGVGETIAAYAAAISAAEVAGDVAVLAEALRRLAVICHHDNRSDEARALCRRSQAVAQTAGNRLLAAEALNTLGGIDLETGAVAEAHRHFRDALDSGHGNRDLRARVEQNLGILASIQGDVEEAQRCYARSLEAYREANDRHGSAIAFHNLGMASADRGELDQAEEYFRHSYEIAERLGDEYLTGLCLVNHAKVHVARERYEEARGNIETALTIFDRPGTGSAKADAHRVLGMIYRETGRPGAAESELRLAIDLSLVAGSVLNEADAARELAVLYLEMGRNQEALGMLNAAHRLFGQVEARAQLVYVEGKRAALDSTYRAVVLEWGRSIESRDVSTFGHCERVADHAVAVARALGMDEQTQTTIRLGAYLHDLGKVRVPLEILNKSGPLSGDEAMVMQRHPGWGVELLAGIDFPWDLKPIIRCHHERYDGGGYPNGLVGDAIPLTAQIVGLVDVYDALTTTRPYRPALSPAAALAELERRPGQWAPAVYAALLESLAALGSPVAEAA